MKFSFIFLFFYANRADKNWIAFELSLNSILNFVKLPAPSIQILYQSSRKELQFFSPLLKDANKFLQILIKNFDIFERIFII